MLIQRGFLRSAAGTRRREGAGRDIQLFGTASSQVTFWTLLAILFVSVVQIHGIIGNMTVSGSARDEYAARFGAVSGTYAKRIMISLGHCGLIAIAVSGHRRVVGSRRGLGHDGAALLGPGLLGLMMMAACWRPTCPPWRRRRRSPGCLCARHRYLRPALTDREAVTAAGRRQGAAVGVIARRR